MSTLIECNGLRNGPIETLYATLQNYTLDPLNADYYDKLEDIDNGLNGNKWLTGERPEQYKEHTHLFSGNFYKISACFRVATSDPAVISTLITLIETNQSSADFIQIKQDLIEHEARLHQACLNKIAAKHAERERQARETLGFN